MKTCRYLVWFLLVKKNNKNLIDYKHDDYKVKPLPHNASKIECFCKKL